ncbi:MAG: copper amine oxidase N-terminal domain-containing protein [Firmicutes bacterium]|nr:copper amine oxidase N-terminal domain-containing protein [Bacillota bacterium]
MKRKIALTLTAISVLAGASTVFASDALTKAYSDSKKTDLSGLTAKYTDSGDNDNIHAVPAGFDFESGVVSGKTGDFDGDGEEELLTVYAENTDKEDLLYVQMYEEKDGKAELAATSDKITNFLWGEKGGGCVFVKKVDGKNRIFMQYTGEINSYGDGADVQIKGFDYDGSKFDVVLDVKTGGSAADFEEKEAEEFKAAGLNGTFDSFVLDEEKAYHFNPYYDGLNIGALEKDKEMITDITVTTNIFDIYDKIDWEKEEERLEAAEKDGKMTITLKTSSEVKAAAEEEKPEVTETKDPNKIEVFLNGEKMTFDSEPYIENGTTRVPMRAIFEGLGAKVDWDNDKKLVTAEKGGVEIKLTIGEETALVNGEENKLLVPAEIKNSRTMVPLRFVSEALGAKVDWDGETKTITITNEEAPAVADEEEKPAEKGEEKPSVYEQNVDKYSSVISKLKDKDAFAFAAVSEDKDILLVAENVYDDLNGHNAAIEATAYADGKDGKIEEIGSVECGGTAYPLAVKDGALFYAGGHWIAKAVYDEKSNTLTETEKATVSFDKDENETYTYVSEDKELEGKEAEDKFTELFAEYDKAVIIDFKSAE